MSALSPGGDPLRRLFAAARAAVQDLTPDDRARRVVVFNGRGRVVDCVIPP